jgi:hypothetical protein
MMSNEGKLVQIDGLSQNWFSPTRAHDYPALGPIRVLGEDDRSIALHMLREAQSPAGSTKQLSSFLFAVE